MKVLILDTNTVYSKRIKYYIEKKYAGTRITICDNFDAAKSILQSDNIDVVLFDEGFEDIDIEEQGTLLKAPAFAYISSTDEIVNEMETLLKYCRVSEIYERICDLYEKKKNRTLKKNIPVSNEGTGIIGFFPVHGGAGSSTVAAACAISMASQYKVLYINLEQRPSDSVFFKGRKEGGLDDIVTYMRGNSTEKGLRSCIEEAIDTDRTHGNVEVSFIRGFSNILEYASLTDKLVENLLLCLKEKFDYKFIIIDTDFIVGDILKKIIKLSDSLVFVSSGADTANVKLTGIQRYLEILERSDDFEAQEKYLFFNQYYGVRDERAIAKDMEIIARIARYKNQDGRRVESTRVVSEILKGKDAFAALKPVSEPEPGVV